MAARAATEAEMLEPWRKNFPICKPYAAHDKADAVRFLRELEEGCDGMDADTDYTLGEVIRGDWCSPTGVSMCDVCVYRET